MKHPVSRELHRYWTALRRHRAAPERADLDPAAIRGILADTFILETEPSEAAAFRFRLSGARLNALWLTDLKGCPLPSLFRPEDRDGIGRALRTVVDHQVPAVAGLRAAPAGESRAIHLELLLLPLKHRGRTHARMLGAAAPFAVPSWLGLVPVEGFELVSVRYLDEETAAPAALASPGRRRGHLVVHDGGFPA